MTTKKTSKNEQIDESSKSGIDFKKLQGKTLEEEEPKNQLLKLKAGMIITPLSIKFGESQFGKFLIINCPEQSYITSAKNILNYFETVPRVRGTVFDVVSIGTYKGYDVLDIVPKTQSKLGDYTA